MYNISIGTDPEVFVRTTGGEYVSGHDLIPGTKHEPHKVPFGAIQVDGVALEFNTDPAYTEDQFTHNIEAVLSSVSDHYKLKRPDLVIAMTPTATFSKEYFDGLPEEPKLLGCTPDFNAYTGSENEPPSTDEPFRTGSGHIHVGWGSGFQTYDEDHFEMCCQLVRNLDTVLFVSSLLWDADNKRRTLYGKIGAFRPKVYGVEYRPLSNAYLVSKDIQRFVFTATKTVADSFLNSGVDLTTDEYAKAMVESLRDNQSVSTSEIREYLSYMHSKYGVPLYA